MHVSKRPIGLGVTLVALIALAAVGLATQFGGAGASASSNPDKIVYSQQNGAKGQYLQYVPGDGSKATTQAVTGGGGCATPNVSGSPILQFSAKSYPNGYNNASQPAIVGTFNNRTGVCSTPQAWSLEVGEGLVFAPGPNSLTAGRLFVSANLFLEREDKAGGTLTGRMIERVGTTQVGTKSFSITSGTINVDTGTVPTGFNSLEIQVLTPAAGSISVVGPTSTFVFAGQICPGESITDTSTGGTQTSGEVTATITYESGSGCKSYTDFHTSSTDIASSDGKSMTFLSQPLAGAHITIHIDWGNLALCRSDATSDPNVPPCPTSLVDLGNGAVPETYCAAATVSQPVCSTFKQFTNIPDPANASNTVTHEVEDFDAIGDIFIRH